MFAGPSHSDWEETADVEQHRVKMRRVAAANRLFVFNDLDAADQPQTEAKLESADVTRLEYLLGRDAAPRESTISTFLIGPE
jgi:hypothetical protein